MTPRAATVEERTASRADTTARNRARILAAALEEFASRGFDATSTAEIARRAGVTQPLVHYHFDSKDALWRAAVEHAVGDIVLAFDGIDVELATVGPIEQMAIVVRRFVRFTAVHPELSRIVSYEGVAGGERLTWLIENRFVGNPELFRDIYADLVAQGLAVDLPFELVTTALAAAAAYPFIIRATMRELNGIDVTESDVIESHADTVVTIFLGGLLTDDGRRSHAGAAS